MGYDFTMAEDGPRTEEISPIAAQGDLLLRVEYGTADSPAIYSFRVDSSVLKSHSKYFDRLLQNGRFSEGTAIRVQHDRLVEQYGQLTAAPSSELPAITIVDVGRISAVRALDALVSDFLSILHGDEIQASPPVPNLANLAIVADRFDALDIVKSYVKRKKILRALDGKTTAKVDTGMSEEKVRQRLLLAIYFDYPPWLEKYSARLIIKGWVGNEMDTSSPLWWDLPSRVEEELMIRRDAVLNTIQSVQAHFLTLYTSRQQRCRLGYENSVQCDSFQLGEMIRFFTRIGTLDLQGTLLPTNDPTVPYTGDINALLESMRQIPEYQIDRFHTHCGIRTGLLPILSVLEAYLQRIGICAECWQEGRREYSWLEQKPAFIWKRQDLQSKFQGHGNRHSAVRELFTAAERHWT